MLDLISADLPVGDLPRIHLDNYDSTHKFSNKGAEVLHTYVNSDWAGEILGRRSISGWVLLLGGAVIGYKSRFQDAVAVRQNHFIFSLNVETN